MNGVPLSRRDRSLALGLMLVPWLAFWPALAGAFLWDDDRNVAANGTLTSLEGLIRIWSDPHANQQYYPLTHTSFWIEYQLWGLWPIGFHVVNLLLHGLCAATLYRLLRRLNVAGALFAGAIFALHPVHAESVAWITERKNVLSAWLALLAAERLLEAVGVLELPPGRSARRAACWALALFLAGMLSKTVVCTLPVVLGLIVYWRRGELKGAVTRWLGIGCALGAACGAITAYLERTSVGASGEIWQFSWLERLTIAGRALWFYPRQLLVPYPLAFIYPRWEPSSTDPWGWLGLGAACVTTAVLWFLRERIGRGPFVAWMAYAVMIAPALGFFDLYFFYYSFVQDHFQYHASVALLAGAGWAGTVLLQRLGSRGIRAGVLAGMLAGVALLPLSWRQAMQFQGAQTLWEETLRRNPDAWMAHINLGNIYLAQGKIDEARRQFESALRDRPDYDEALYNLGVVEAQAGNPAAAERRYEQAIAVNPRFVRAYNNLARLLLQRGDRARAIELWQSALDHDPGYVLGRTNLAAVLAAAGSTPAAITVLEQGLASAPREREMNRLLIELLWDSGDREAAQRRARAALGAGVELPEPTLQRIGLQ